MVPRKKKAEPEVTEQVTAEEAAAEEVAPGVDVVEVEAAGTDYATTQVIVFVMDGQQYALPIDAVQEIQQIVGYTRARGADPALVGMVDLRGRVVPLIDLRALLGLQASPYHLDTPLIFSRLYGRLVALIVDEVEDVIDLTGMELQAPSKLYALADRLRGVVRLGETLLMVLDPKRLVPAETLLSAGELEKEVAE